MQAALLQDGGLEELLGQQQGQQAGQQQGQGSGSAAGAPTAAAGAEDGAGPSGLGAAAAGDGTASASAAAKEEAERVDRSYFESYSFFDIHREMLGDKVRWEGEGEGEGEERMLLLDSHTLGEHSQGAAVLQFAAMLPGVTHSQSWVEKCWELGPRHSRSCLLPLQGTLHVGAALQSAPLSDIPAHTMQPHLVMICRCALRHTGRRWSAIPP